MAQLESKATKFYPTKRLDVIADNPDNRLLELALESKAEYIITGNTTDFTMPEFQGTRIVTPKEYWDLYRE